MTQPSDKPKRITDEEALHIHAMGRPGKLEITPTKPLATQRDLALAYSPGVAVPCIAIHKNPEKAYDYTAKGNIVAVISNGTAVLGLGDLGALASKPVMEGKAVLFKRFADIDGIDLEVDTTDVDTFIESVRYLEPSFGGINLEDIKAPDCFIIEQRLKELLKIPVFHDDQHGTAIIALAALMNALELTGRDIKKTRLVVNGAGAAAIACVELLKSYGVQHENVILVDRQGVIYEGRQEGMNQWKSAHAVPTKARSLKDALEGADVFLGLSVKGAVTKEMVKSMASQPIIFAMANPDPEISPEDVKSVREDAIVATGRSDYPNQVNNVLGFPYIFRGALDVRATIINEEMKIAAARAIAALAREDVPDEVRVAYAGRQLRFGPEYIIPVPFDPRLIVEVPSAVARAAMETGVAKKPITDMKAYKKELTLRLDPTAAGVQLIFEAVRTHPQRIIFAEGEEEKMIRAALSYHASGYGDAILIGRDDIILNNLQEMGLKLPEEGGVEIYNAAHSDHNDAFKDFLYKKLQRKGLLYRDVQRMVHQDRNIFGACMVAFGEADGMVTGLTRSHSVVFDEITKVIDRASEEEVLGLSLFITPQAAVFIADTSVHPVPEPRQLAEFACQAAKKARSLGYEPRVAFIGCSTFGNPMGAYLTTHSERIQEALKILDQRKDVDFEYEGEMSPDVALNSELKKLYPFSRLTGPANILIMPGLNSASISSKLLQNLIRGTMVGPLLLGLQKPIEIVSMASTVSEIVNIAVFAAHEAYVRKNGQKSFKKPAKNNR